MKEPQAVTRRLRNQCVFLSIGQPANPSQTFRSPQDARSSLDWTVVALGRALFAAGGRVIMREHEDYTPMLALLAAEYPLPPVAERAHAEKESPPVHPPLILARPRGGPRSLPVGWDALRRSGLIETPSGAEYVLPELFATIEGLRPLAMIIVGGGEDATEDEEIFRSTSPNGLVIPLGFTGGRAATRRREGGDDLGRRTDDIYSRLGSVGRDWLERRRFEGEPFTKEGVGEPEVAFYSPIQATVQLVVRELIERRMR